MILNHRAVAMLLAAASLSLPTTFAEQLPTDPALETGKLDNGIRWIYRHHSNPPGKMALLVHLSSGSLNETDEQRGLAHFIEHMAFNGTQHYPPGTLVPYFESIGMEFGADLNASTGFDLTQYMLFLPDTSLSGIDEALKVLSDFMFRVQFSEKEIEKERGIILSEKLSRRNVAMRLQEEVWKKLYGESHFVQRMPIGTDDVIKNADRDRFIDYYNTWYRPERMTVIMVGDRPSDEVIPLVRKWFNDEKAKAPARKPFPADLRFPPRKAAVVAKDPEYQYCTLSIYNHLPPRPPTTTVEAHRQRIVERLGNRIIARRYSDRQARGEARYQTAAASITGMLRTATLAAASATGTPEQWEEMVTELVEELNRVREYGFQAHELETAARDLRASATRRVKTEETANGNRMLMRYSRRVTDEEPILSAQQRLDLLNRILPTIRVEDVTETFNRNFAPDKFVITLNIVDDPAITVPDEETLLAAMNSALARRVSPPAGATEEQPLIAKEPQPGRITDRKAYPELGITTVRMENGVTVHHRFMDYKKDTVVVSINLGGATLEEQGETLGRSEAASIAFSRPATQRVGSTEITDMLTGRNINVTGSSAPDSLTLRLRGSPTDLELGFRVAHALLLEGRVEPPAFAVWRSQRLQGIKLLGAFPEFQAGRRVRQLTSGDDPRTDTLDSRRYEQVTVEQAQEWLNRHLQSAPIEVAIVGEIPLEAALELAAKYVGSLPKRGAEDFWKLRSLKRQRGPLRARVPVASATDKAYVMVGFIGPDARATNEHRALSLAANVLTSRLIERIREEKAWVYGIAARAGRNYAFVDDSTFSVSAPCKPDYAEDVVAEVKRIFAEFAANGPTSEELENARKQIHNNLDTQMKEPVFWWRAMSDVVLHRYPLAGLVDVHEKYSAVTASQVQDVFRQYFVPERIYDVIASPKITPKAASDEAPVGQSQG